jgi:exonuclease VII small subunit
MALSQQVESSLLEAQQSLRNALSFAARTEKPYIAKHIADMMSNIDNIIHVVPLLEQVEEGLNDSLGE